MSFSHSSSISEDTDNASDIDEGRDLIGLDELLCTREIDHIFNSQAFQTYQKELNPEKKKKVTRNFLQDVKARIQEDLRTNFMYNDRQPCQRLYWELCEQNNYEKEFLNTFINETVDDMYYQFFKNNENDVFFLNNEHGLRIKNKLAEIDILLTDNLKQVTYDYYKLIGNYADNLLRILNEKKATQDETQHFTLYGQLVEIQKQSSDLLNSEIKPEDIFNDYKNLFEKTFMQCLNYFAQNSVTNPFNLSELKHYYSQGVSQLSGEVIQQLQQQGFKVQIDDVNSKHKYIDYEYQKLLKTIAQNGKILKICSEENIKEILGLIIKKFISGTEPATLVVRPVSGYTELIDHCWSAKPNSNNRISIASIYRLNTFEKDKNKLQKEVFSELFLLELQEALKNKLNCVILLQKSISQADNEQKAQLIKQVQRLYKRVYQNTSFFQIQYKLIKNFINNIQYSLFEPQIEEMLYQKLMNVDIYSSLSEIQSLIGDISQNISSGYESTQNKEFFMQLMKQQLSSSPLFIQLLAHHILRSATISVNLQGFQNSISDEQILKILKYTYSQLTAKNRVDPESAEFLISQEHAGILAAPHTPLYHFNDVLSPVLFLDNKPLLLFSDLSACGQNRWTYFLLAFIMQKQLPGIEVQIQSPKWLNDILEEQNINVASILKYSINQAIDIIKIHLNDESAKFLARDGYASLQGNLNLKPFNFSLRPPKAMEAEIIANFKNQRICVALRAESDYVRFVIVDQFGHYITEIELREYFRQKLFNPAEKDAELSRALNQYFHGAALVDDIKQNQKVENMEFDEDNAEVKLFNGFDKEYVVQLLQKSFAQQIKKDYDARIQRIIEEARLIDFLLSHGVSTIFIGINGFRTKQLKQNVENTVKFIHQQSKYLPDNAYRDNERVYVHSDGLRGIVEKNPLYIPGLLFKPLKLAQFVTQIRINKVQLAIPAVLAAALQLNEFDMSMNAREERYYVYGMDTADFQAHQSYCRSQTKNLMTILDNYIATDYVSKREDLGITTVPWRYNDGKIIINIEKNANNRLSGKKRAQDIELRDKTTVTAIWAARFATDPLCCYAALAEGGHNIAALLKAPLINFFSYLQPYKQEAVLDVIRPVPHQGDVFDYLINTNDYLKSYALHALQTSICRRAYDLNLIFVAPHYVYALMLLPRIDSCKLQYLIRNAQTAGAITREKIKSYLAMEQGQQSLGITGINIFGNFHEIEQGAIRGEYFASKEAVASSILQQLISYNSRCLAALQKMQEQESEQFELGVTNIAEQCPKLPKVQNILKIFKSSHLSNCVNNCYPHNLFIQQTLDQKQLLQQVKDLCGLQIDWEDMQNVFNQEMLLMHKNMYLNGYIAWIFLGCDMCKQEKWEHADITEIMKNISMEVIQSILEVTNQVFNDISISSTISTDVLFATPTSPYAIPLSYEALYENQLIGTLHCMGKLVQFQGTAFRPEQYLSRCNLDGNDITLSININRFFMALEELRYVINYDLYGAGRAHKYLAVPCAYGDITRNMHEDDGFQGDFTQTESSDVFTDSSEESERQKRRKHHSSSRKHKTVKETAKLGSDQVLHPKLRSWYIRQKDSKSMCWSDQLPLADDDLRTLELMAKIATKLATADPAAIPMALDSLLFKEEALCKIFYIKVANSHQQSSYEALYGQQNGLFDQQSDVERNLSQDAATWAGQAAQQLFYCSKEERFHFRVFGGLYLPNDAKQLLRGSDQPFNQLLTFLADNQAQLNEIKQLSFQNHQGAFKLLKQFVDASKTRGCADVCKLQLLEVLGVSDPLRTVDQVDEKEMLDIFGVCIDQNGYSNEQQESQQHQKRQKRSGKKEDIPMQNGTYNIMIQADPLLQNAGVFQSGGIQSSSIASQALTFWRALFGELRSYDIELRDSIDLSRILNVFQAKPGIPGQLSYTPAAQSGQLSPFQTELDSRTEFLQCTGWRSFRNCGKYEQFQVHTISNQPSSGANLSARIPRVTCDAFAGVPCYDIGTTANPGQNFISFLDSIAFDGPSVAFTRITGESDNICDILQQYYENGWRYVLTKMLIDDCASLVGWRGRSGIMDGLADVAQFFNQPKFGETVSIDDVSAHLRAPGVGEVEAQLRQQKGGLSPPEPFGRRLSLAQQLIVAFPGAIDTENHLGAVQLINELARLHANVPVQSTSISMLTRLMHDLQPHGTVTTKQILQQVICSDGSYEADGNENILENHSQENSYEFPLIKLIKMAHCNVREVLFYFSRLQSRTFGADLRNAIDPQGDVVDFERIVNETDKKFFNMKYTKDQVRNYMQNQRGNMPIFIPVSGSYSQISMFGPFKTPNSSDVQCLKVTVYENIEQKPSNGMKWLSKDLYVKPYECFTGLSSDLREKEIHFTSLEEIYEKYYSPLVDHLKEFCGSKYIKVCSTIQEVQDNTDQGIYIVLSSAASLKFSYLYRRSNKNLTHEIIYIVWGGYVFRNTFIAGGFQSFKSWIQKNFKTFGLTGNHYVITDVDKQKFD